jgi:hypothetical protein
MAKFLKYRWQVQWIEDGKVLVRPKRRECDARRLEREKRFESRQHNARVELGSVEVFPIED